MFFRIFYNGQIIVPKMSLQQHLNFLLLLTVLLCQDVKSNIRGILVNKRACSHGGPSHFNATGGTITSPLHPRGPLSEVNCTWILHNQHKDTLILSFSKFDLDQDKKCGKQSYQCCFHQWLTIKTQPSLKVRRSISHFGDKKRKKKKKDVRDHRRNVSSKHGERRQKEDGHQRLFDAKRKNRWLGLLKSPIFNTSLGSLHGNKDDNVASDSETQDSKKGKFTGHICGVMAPAPIITTDPLIIIHFFSDKMIELGHKGFSLQYQITNNITVCNGATEFKCHDPPLCIPKSWKCNGQAECPDSSDEAECQAGCPGLADSDHCDGRWHCINGEDELGCYGCDADEWWCGEGKECYKASSRCDGNPDCPNRIDEVYCNCFNQTRCGPNSEFCYDPKTQQCDGKLHCPNGHDELDCDDHCPRMIPCGLVGECYTTAQRCDGISQCGDGSDEASCTPQLCHPQHGAFLCANRRCIQGSRRCDQFDDCGDASDEEDCLRNSVIVAAAMGGLVCSLLLVIAVGCTCRLYALRMGISQYQQQSHRGGRRSASLAPLSQLEQHLLQREPPPSYSVAVNDPSAALFGSRRHSRHWRRQRRRPPAPPEGVFPPLPVPMRGRLPPVPPHPYNSAPEHTPNQLGSNMGCRSSNDEKETEEEAKTATDSNPVPQTSVNHHNLPVSTTDDDVPLLSAVDNNAEDYDDTPLLEITSTSEDSGDDGRNDDDDDLLDVALGLETSETEVSDVERRSEVDESTSSDRNRNNAESNIVLIPSRECEIGQHHPNERSLNYSASTSVGIEECSQDNDSLQLYPSSPDTASLLGDMMSDTKAAVLALSVVQKHTNDAQQADTELTSQ